MGFRRPAASARMLVKRDEFWQGYVELKSDGGKAPVQIFTSAADCDSCCGFRILKAMLESDNITYSVLAVSGYDDLLQRVKQLPRDNKVSGPGRSLPVCRPDCLPMW